LCFKSSISFLSFKVIFRSIAVLKSPTDSAYLAWLSLLIASRFKRLAAIMFLFISATAGPALTPAAVAPLNKPPGVVPKPSG
jgi:hypothetical protein